ncbi:MAG: hypothetical protein JSU01_02410, partial [Bacteroidetes bacterium]|nr:hypothetical protein [Bacteroidota bacterium]
MNITTENILKQVVVRIQCNGEKGSGVIHFPENNLGSVYVITAKHCLLGKKFDRSFVNSDIKIDKIYNQTRDTFSEYRCTDDDKIVLTDNEDDVALIIIQKASLLEKTGNYLDFKLIDKNQDKLPVHFRGFPHFTENETDRPFDARFVEEIKSHTQKFQLDSLSKMDSYYSPSSTNMAGTSGSGLFVIRENAPFLIGILTDIDQVDSFFGTKLSVLNDWLIEEKLPSLTFYSLREAAAKIELESRVNDAIEKI